MSKMLLLVAGAILAVTTGSLFAQGTMMPLPAHSSTFTGNVRGYWFTAPCDFTISGLRVPTDASTGDQSIEVVRLDAAPPAFSSVTNNFTQLFRQVNVAGTSVLTANIQVTEGDVIGILGYRGTSNSYGANPYTTTINGQSVTLARLGMQYNLTTTPAQDLWTETANGISRVEMYYTIDDPEIQVQRPAGTALRTGIADDLGTITAGQASNFTWTVENFGSSNDLTISSISAASSGVGNCSVTASPTLSPSSPIAAGGTATFSIDVTPSAAGNFEFTITINNNDQNEGTFTRTITGSAVASINPEIDVQRPTGTSIADGGTDNVSGTVAATTTNLTYTVANSGGTDLTLTGATPVTTANLVNCTVTITSQPASPVAANGGTQTFGIDVTPGVTGTWSFDMAIANNDSNENPYDITVTGNATATLAPEITVLRGTTNINDGGTDSMTNTGTAQFNVIYTIRNDGSQDLNLTGAAGSEVVVSGMTNCTVVVNLPTNTTIASAASETFSLDITPSAAGAFSFNVSIDNDDSNENPFNFTFNGDTATGSGGGGSTIGGGGGGGGGGGCAASTALNWSWLLLLGALGGALATVRRRRA